MTTTKIQKGGLRGITKEQTQQINQSDQTQDCSGECNKRLTDSNVTDEPVYGPEQQTHKQQRNQNRN